MSLKVLNLTIDFSQLKEIEYSEDELLSPSEEKIQEVALSTLQTLRYVWYALVYFLAACTTLGIGFKRESIFEGNTGLITTHNYAKWKDLKSYASMKPEAIPSEITRAARLFGFEPPHPTVRLKPVDGGKCFGGVLHFFQQANAHGVEAAAAQFEGGMPMASDYYQTIYNNLETPICPEMIPFLKEILCAPLTGNQSEYANTLKEKWIREFGEESAPIVEGVLRFVQERNDPNKVNLLEWFKEQYGEEPIFYTYYGTLRTVAADFFGKNLDLFDSDRLACTLAGFDLEVIHHEEKATTVTSALNKLEAGYYIIDLTAYSIFGQKSGTHATALIIHENHSCTFLEPNFAVGTFTDRSLLSQTVGRTFKTYNDQLFNADQVKGYSLYRATPVN